MKLIIGTIVILVMPFIVHNLGDLLFVLTGIIAAFVIASFFMQALETRSHPDDTMFQPGHQG